MARTLPKLAIIFAGCAGLSAGGVIGAGWLAQRQEAPPPAAQTAPAASSVLYSHPLQATITSVDADGVAQARLRVWPAQFAAVSLCLRAQTAAGARCAYEATVEGGAKAAAGGTVTLRDIAAGSFAAASAKATPPQELRPRQDIMPGPVPARVIRLIDGDTVQVAAHTFPNSVIITDIRIGGIDTPEKGSRAKCSAEAALATRATAQTRALIEGREVTLHNVQFEKYGGRMLADIRTLDGRDAGQNLVRQGLARPYDGGRKSGWCGPA